MAVVQTAAVVFAAELPPVFFLPPVAREPPVNAPPILVFDWPPRVTLAPPVAPSSSSLELLLQPTLSAPAQAAIIAKY
jgi:hypothetical protein